MLTELSIRDFAIIDHLRLEMARGFTVLTGETGAGKSIILDALSLVLGERADKSQVRAGKDQAFIDATFSLSPGIFAKIKRLIEREGLEHALPNTLQLGREIRSNGRSICRVNGRSVSLNLLRQVAEPLVDIHGQGEHLSLLKPRAHLPLLDAYGGLVAQRNEFSLKVDQLRDIQRELDSLQRDERLIAQRIDMLNYQINEIGAADLRDGEEKELREERKRLSNAEQLTRFALEISARLTGTEDGETLSAVDLLGQAERAMRHLVDLDDSQTKLLDNLEGLTFQINEFAAEVQDYQNKIEFNPTRLNEVEERLELIGTLKRKYGDSIAEVLASMEKAENELGMISHSEERMAELDIKKEKFLREIGRLGGELSQKRQAVAEKLSAAVEAQLTDLQMSGARFEVSITREEDSAGAYIADRRFSFDRSGVDIGEFLITANPGEPLKPMAKVASGGETSRLMLALKAALAEVDATPTLIFDEIDQGIGGRIGAKVGKKLWGLSTVGDHQVVVVTHLPQLAGYGDVHFQVRKLVINDRTRTTVSSLDTDGRIHELADMLGTQGGSAVDGAQAIIREVQAVKKQSVR